MNKYIVAGFAVFFAVKVVSFFGWSLQSQSPDEVICDGIVLVLVSIAISMCHKEEK